MAMTQYNYAHAPTALIILANVSLAKVIYLVHANSNGARKLPASSEKERVCILIKSFNCPMTK